MKGEEDKRIWETGLLRASESEYRASESEARGSHGAHWPVRVRLPAGYREGGRKHQGLGHRHCGVSGPRPGEQLFADHDANVNITSLGISGNVVGRFIYCPIGTGTVLKPAWEATIDAYSWQYMSPGMHEGTVTRPDYAPNRGYNPATEKWAETDPAGYVDGGSLYQAFDSEPASTVDGVGTDPVKTSGPEGSTISYDPDDTLAFGPPQNPTRTRPQTSRTFGLSKIEWLGDVPALSDTCDVYTHVDITWHVNISSHEDRSQYGYYDYYFQGATKPHVEINLSRGPGQNRGSNIDRNISAQELQNYADTVSGELSSSDTSGSISAVFTYETFCQALDGLAPRLATEDGVETEVNSPDGKPNRQRVAYRTYQRWRQGPPAGWDKPDASKSVAFNFNWVADSNGKVTEST